MTTQINLKTFNTYTNVKELCFFWLIDIKTKMSCYTIAEYIFK